MKRKLTVFSALALLLALPVQAQGIGLARDGEVGAYLFAVGISFLIALIVVCVLKAGMKNVRVSREAGNYVSRALHLTHRSDRFTHTTTTRRKIETSSGTKVRR